MKLLLCLLGMSGMPLAAAANDQTPAPGVEANARNRSTDVVVLLHGLGRTRLSMLPLAWALEREGYRVVNLSYPSLSTPLETLATTWLPEKLQERGLLSPSAPAGATRPRLHFVTHSMGGLLVRLWLRENGVPENLGSVVMLGPPNAGSEIPDRLQSFPPFGWCVGVNGRRLTTTPESLPHSLGPWPAAGTAGSLTPHGELGFVAGEQSLTPVPASWVPRPNDGKVSVASTHLAGATDHIVLQCSHTLLIWRRAPITQVKTFLRTGRFASNATVACTAVP